MVAKRKPPKLSEFQTIVLDNLPWVHYYCEPRQCTGWMRSNKKCKNPARWRFTSQKSRSDWAMDQPNGIYCWSHLISRGIYSSMGEEARTDAMFRKKGILCSSSKKVISSHDGREYTTFCVRSAHTDPIHHSELFRRLWDDDYTPLRCHHNWTD